VKKLHWALGALLLLSLPLVVPAADAQTKAETKAPAAKAKPKSACNAKTDEAACKADATCAWVAALMDAKTGKQKRKAYCRSKPKPPAKKEPAKK